MVGEACLPSNAYYPRTPDYTVYSGVHVCWSGHSDSSFFLRIYEIDLWLGYHDHNYLNKTISSDTETFMDLDLRQSLGVFTTNLALRRWF